MSTPPQMMPRATGRAGEADDDVEVMGPMEVGSSPGASKRKRPRDAAAEARGAAEPEPTVDELAEALFATTHGLKHTGRLCMEAAEPGLRAISFPRGRVLMVMDDARPGRVRMGDLAEALGVTARNVTTIVDGLEREGLLARKPDPTDRRAILLELTERGKEQIAQVHALHRAIAERFFAPLDAGERCVLLRLLGKIRGGQGDRDS